MDGILILARHAQSRGNEINIFTGRRDLPLSDFGEIEAVAIATEIEKAQIKVDEIYTSSLMRARQTAEIVAAQFGGSIPIIPVAAFDERDYGQLTGMNKEEAARLFGADQIRNWRRSFEQRPPGGESLRDTRERVKLGYEKVIVPRIQSGKNVLVIAHGNSLRALIMDIENIAPRDIVDYEIATGEIIIYRVASTYEGSETVTRLS